MNNDRGSAPARSGFPCSAILMLVSAFALGIGGAQNDSWGADLPLPDGGSVIDDFVAASGGKTAFEKIRNRVSKGHHEFVGMGLKGTQAYYAARPNKRYIHIEMEEMGTVEQGCDGRVSWYKSPMTGVLVESGDALAAALHDSAFDRQVHWRRFYKKVECVDVVEVEGKSCYEVILTPKEGATETHYYDRETKLLVMVSKTRLSSHMPPTPTDIYLADYKRVDGVLLPHSRKQVTEQCGSKREILFTTKHVAHNVMLASDRFDLPDDVAEQVKETSTISVSSSVKRAPCGSGMKAKSASQAKAVKPAPCGGG